MRSRDTCRGCGDPVTPAYGELLPRVDPSANNGLRYSLHCNACHQAYQRFRWATDPEEVAG